MPPARSKRRTFLREWRIHRNRTLVQAAEQLGITHGQLSKVERGLRDYSQTLLEALADLYMCAPADLLIRNPLDPEGLWSIWDQAKTGERQQIVEVAKALIRTRAA